MKGIEKQLAGFRFGKYRTKVLKEFGAVQYQGPGYKRVYKVVSVLVEGGQTYGCIRVYNGSVRFIKQLLFEPEVAGALAEAVAGCAESEARRQGG